ncbi:MULTISPECIES: hypothetical protein [unclassified Streptomyces]
MNENAPQTTAGDGLLVARTSIVAARSRAEQPSDGGSTGVSDSND